MCALTSLCVWSVSSATAKQNPIPSVNQSGSSVFDALRNKALQEKLPLVIYMTGSSWCVYCNVFTKTHINTPNFQQSNGKKFIFWLVDSLQVRNKQAGTFTFAFIPEEAGKVVGCLDSKAPYTVLGPPAVLILDPVSGKLLKKISGEAKLKEEGKPLEQVIEDCWQVHLEEAASADKSEQPSV